MCVCARARVCVCVCVETGRVCHGLLFWQCVHFLQYQSCDDICYHGYVIGRWFALQCIPGESITAESRDSVSINFRKIRVVMVMLIRGESVPSCPTVCPPTLGLFLLSW